MAAQGQNFFAASGDSSTWSSSNEAWPADDAYVVSVGGTDLVTSGAAGPWASETLPDARVAQFWDPRHSLSEAIRRAAQSNQAGVLGDQRLHGRVVWDFVAIYPAGVRWSDA